MTGERRWWRAAAALGLVMMATVVWFGLQPMPDCGRPLAQPMLAFELALDRSDLAAVLDCAPRRAELDRQNIVDLALFMWAYALFFAAFARAAGAGRVAVGLLVVTMLGGDLVETILLRALASAWPSLDPALLLPLAIGSRLKFLGIAAILALCGMLLWRRRSWGARLVAALAVASALVTVVALYPPALPLFPLCGVGWLAMMLYAVVNALRSPRSPPASPAV